MQGDIAVFKFGGASVKDAASIRNVSSIISAYDKKLVIVISAMGKMTNALEKVTDSYLNSNTDLEQHLSQVTEQHEQVAEQLDLNIDHIRKLLKSHINQASSVLNQSHENNPLLVYDQIVSLGELFSTTIISEYLRSDNHKAYWLDVRKVMKTDNTYREGRVDVDGVASSINEVIRELLPLHDVIITQGFLGMTSDGYTTTLGREGSDYTAAILGYALNVKDITIWKDVPGILSADPKKFSEVSKIPKLSYNEAIEMTYYGAKVIHPKTIQPIQNRNIKLHVKSFQDISETGTVISDVGMSEYPPIITVQDKISLIQIFTKDFTFIAEEHLSLIFSTINELRIKLRIMRNAAVNFSIAIITPDEDTLDSFVDKLGDNFRFQITKNLEIITVRHHYKSIIDSLVNGRTILLQETMQDTIQMVVSSPD